jgi:transposase IS4-like protein/DDE family transposase
MPRELAELPKGSRITDYISLGVIAEAVPLAKVQQVLAETGRASIRQRDLPAHVMVYYLIAMALYMQSSYREVLRCLREGLVWLFGPETAGKTAVKSAISQARKRLGVAPMRQLYFDLVKPIATERTPGAFYRDWRLVSLDGSTLDLADTEANAAEFGRPGGEKGVGAYPQLRLVSLVENGTHVLFGLQFGGYRSGESVLARGLLPELTAGMLCLADRYYFGYDLWRLAAETGADLLWRGKKNLVLPCVERLGDGSYLSRIYASPRDRRLDHGGITVRVIEYRLEGVPEAEPFYRVLTTILEPERGPAEELAALYPERWEIETAFDELKTHLRGGRIVLRSKTPDGVAQELYGLLLAHYAVRGLMHEAALSAGVDPDRLSFVHAVRVVRRKLPHFVSISP